MGSLTQSATLEDEYGMANLTTVSWEKLLSGDPAESAILASACIASGFFYLDLSGEKAQEYCKTVSALFELSKEYFARSLVEKMKDSRDELDVFNICGFKPLGKLGLDAGIVENKKNGCEHLRVPIDVLFNPEADPRLRCAEGVKENWHLFQTYISASHTIATTVLARLSDTLGLQGPHRFEAQHTSTKPSTSIAALQYYPSTDLPLDTSVGHFAHTDTGSLTILFNSEWGLQAYNPARSAWEHVAPRPNCAIINVGDALKFLSKQALTSSLHRVVPWQRQPGLAQSAGGEREASARRERYAAIFFLRPNNGARFVDGEGVEWKADEWLARKFQNFRAPHWEQERNAISTGKRGFTGTLLEGAKGDAVAV